MKRLIPGLALILVCASVGTGHAQVKAGAISLTPFVGGYTFGGDEDFKSTLTYGLRVGYNATRNWGYEALFYSVGSENKSLAGNPDVDLFGYGVEGLYHFMPEKRLVPYLAVGMGGTHYGGAVGPGFKRDRIMADYGAGLKFFLTENWALRADVRHVFTFTGVQNWYPNDRLDNLLYTVGLTFSFGGEKKAAPSVMTTRAAEPAAPAPPPVEVVLDSDGDGVPDNRDKCPGTPAGVKVDKDGCPIDSDGDGVPDYLDKCPGTPAGVKVDKDGCPPLVVQKSPSKAASAVETAIVEKGRATLNVEFDFDKSVVKKQYHEEIGNLATVMKKYPDLRIVIEGHTDNIGAAKYNEKLSQRRADAIKKYLAEKFGIDASRLTAKGYGLSKPVASNATKEGRQKNRRVDAVAEYIIKK